MPKRKLSTFLTGSNNLNANNFTSLISGGRKSKNKKLKNVSNKSFLNNHNLISRYGLFGDADNDNYPNFKDCYPFDNTRHQTGPTIPQSLQPPPRPSVVAPVMKTPQVVQTRTKPAGTLGRTDIDLQLRQKQQQLSNLDAQNRANLAEFQRNMARDPTAESVFANRRRDFLANYSQQRERLARQSSALNIVKQQLGAGGYVSQQAVGDFVAGRVGDIGQDIRRARAVELARRPSREAPGIIEPPRIPIPPPGVKIKKPKIIITDPTYGKSSFQGFDIRGEPVYKPLVAGPVPLGYSVPVFREGGQLVRQEDVVFQGTPEQAKQFKMDLQKGTFDPVFVEPPSRREQTFGERFIQLAVFEDPILGRLARGIQKIEGQEPLGRKEKIFFRPETPTETARREQTEKGFQSVPFGLQPYRSDDPRFQVTKSLVITPIETVTGKKVPSWAGETIDFYIKMGLFSLHFGTATAQKAEAVVKAKTEESQMKALKEFIKNLGKETETKTVNGKKIIKFVSKDKLFQTRMRDVNKVMSKIIQETDPNKRASMLRGANELFRSAYGDAEASKLLTEWASQQGFSAGLGQGRIPSLGTMETGFTPELTIDITKLGGVPQMPRVPEISTFTKLLTGIQEKTQEPQIKPFSMEKEQTKDLQSTATLFDMGQPQDTRQRPETRQDSALSLLTPQIPRLKPPRTIQTTDTTTSTIFSPPGVSPPPSPPTRPQKKPIKKPPLIPFFFPGEEGFREEQIGYDSFYKKDATKKTKSRWIQINTKPQSRASGFDLVSKKIDKNISATGEIRPIMRTKTVKGKKSKQPKTFKKLPTGDNYFNLNSYKFRDFSQRKGKIITHPNRIIEKSQFRSDMPGEKKALKVGRQQAKFTFGGFGGFNNAPRKKSKKRRRGGFRL